jgi:hypothetical protein
MAITDADRHIADETMVWWGGIEAAGAPGAGPASDPAAGDAFDHLGADLGLAAQDRRRLPVADKTGYRTIRAPVEGAFDPVAFKFAVACRAHHVAATAPDYGHFFEAGGFGTGAGGLYTRQLAPQASAWFWGASADGMIGHSYAGAVVSEMALAFGEDLARWDFTGQAAKASTIERVLLAANAAAGQAYLELTVATCGWVVNAPVWVKVGASATVHKVTAYDSTTGRATISPVVPGGGYTLGDAVVPYSPSRTLTTENPVAEHNCSLDLNAGAEEILITKGTLTIKTGMELRAKEAHSDFRNGVVAKRVPDGAVITADMVYTLAKAKLQKYARDLTTKDLLITLGPAASRRITIDGQVAKVMQLPTVEAEDGPRMGTMTLALYGPAGDDVAISYI